jgi:hypothetical protein
MEAVLLHLRQANKFVARHHRHSIPTVGGKFVLDDLRVVAFLVEVKALRYAGILTQAQADALLGPGNILLLSVTRR